MVQGEASDGRHWGRKDELFRGNTKFIRTQIVTICAAEVWTPTRIKPYCIIPVP